MRTILFESAQNVRIEYEYASSVQRAAAALIDGVAMIIYIIIVLFAFASFQKFDSMLFFELILIKLPWIFYHPIMEYLLQGQTLGKYMLGIRVVTHSGERPGLKEIFTRWIFKGYFLWIAFSFTSFLGGAPELVFTGLIQLCIGFIGFMYSSVSLRNQRIGDAMAGTVVIRNKSNIRYSLKDVLSIKNTESYTPTYHNATRFTDEDMLLIKNVIQRVKRYPNEENKKLAVDLAEEAAQLIGLEEVPEKRFKFLQTLLHDYVVLTR